MSTGEHHHHHHHHHHHSDDSEKFKNRNLTYRKIRKFTKMVLFRLMIIAAIGVTVYTLVLYAIGGREENIDAPVPMQHVQK